MSFTKKRIDVEITLASGNFGSSQSNTVTLKNHHVVVDIANAGGEAMGAVQMRIYGLSQEMMNQLTVVGPIAAAIRGLNKIRISAGDDVRGMKLIYVGVIDQSWADYHGAPDVMLNIVAFAGLDVALTPVPAQSFKGGADVAGIMEGFAKTAGLTFENNGVVAKLQDPYFPGTTLTQIKDCARAADIRYTIDRGVLAIWPMNGYRKGSPPVVSPQTGLVGYPSFTSNGVTLVTEFNPDTKIGGQIKLDSSLKAACGLWTVYTVAHSLESERAGGSWFSQLQCVPNVQPTN